ncbi:LIM and calponin homology domains-containing protein 1-like [Anneissia japonica]|uniref:LIM and calponin homology domains-containing protein 1-like n=1 Tax=Anneissia japonica TaxID=1529436 RepID=UPI001425B73C|nr:LIM and calponin homology domains-containing protein 1-like [Anneissia japonica]
MQCLKPGSITKINRLPTVHAEVNNISIFLNACEEFGLNRSQLFHSIDLQALSSLARQRKLIQHLDLGYTPEERRTEEERRLKKVCTTLYWLGRVAAQRHNYLGPQLNLDEFAPLIFGFARSSYKETTSSGISSYDSSDTTTSRYALGLLDDVFVHNEENVRHYRSRAWQSNRISTSSSEGSDNEGILSGFDFLSSSREDIFSSSDCLFSREYHRRRRRAAMERMHSSGLSRSFDSSMLNHKEMTPEESDEWMSSLTSWKSKRIQYTSTERERKAERDEVEQNETQRQRRKSKTYREIVEEKEKREKALQKIYKKKASVDDEDIDYIMKTDTKLINMSEDEDSSPEEENFEPQTRYRSNTLPKSFGSQFKEAPPTAPKPATRLARRIQAHKKAPEESSAPPVRNRPSVIGLFDEPDGGKKPEPERVNEPIVQQQFNSMEKSKPHDFRGNFQSKLVSAREREHAENSKNSVWQPEKRRVSLGIKSRMAAYNQSLDLDSQVPKKPEPKKDDELKPESDREPLWVRLFAKNRPFIEKTISMSQRPCNEKGFGFTFSGGSEVKKPPIIEKIKKYSTASSTDIQPGDVIVSVNGDKVLSASYEEIEYSISHAVLIGKMSIKIRRYDENADSGSVPLDDNPFKSMLSDEPIVPPSMGVKRSIDRKIATHEQPVRDVPTSRPAKKAPVKLPETRNQYRQQSYSPPLNRNQSNHQQDESVVDGRVIEEPMIQPQKKESKTFASQELFKPIVEDVCQQHVLHKDEGAQDLDALFNKLEQIKIKAEKEKDADDERSMSETEAEQYEAEIIEQMQREAEAERQREERHRSIEQDEMPVEALVSHTVKKPEPNLNFERFQEHNKPVRSTSPSYSVPKPFKTPKYQPVPLRAKKDPEQGREKLTKRRSDFFNEEDGKNVEDLWKQVEQQREKEKPPQPTPAPKANRRSFNVDEERKRLERWQQEQERLRQERYAKDQEKLRQENQKALERAAEDEKRKKQEEEMKINEMTQKLISPREEIDRSVADQFMDKLLEEQQIRDNDARSANVTAERERLARQQQEEAWEREKLLKEKELERKAREREIKLKEERERKEQERLAQARRDEEIRKEHEAMERKLKEEKDRLDRKWKELQREKELQEERERQERERLEQLRAEQDRLRQERFRLEQQQLEEKRLLDQEKERLIRQTRSEAQQHQLPNKSQYRQLAGIAKEPKAIDRDNPFKAASDIDSLEDKFLPKDSQSKNNAQSFARDRNDNKVIPEKDRSQQVSYMSKYKDPSMPQNTHWLVQEAERRRVADQKKRNLESPTNQIKGDLDNEPVLEKEKAFNVESAKTVFTESAPNPKYIEDEQPVRMRPKRGSTKEWQAKKENRRSMPTLDSQLEDDPRQTQDDADVIRRSYGLNDTFAAPPSSTNGPLPDAVMQTFPQNNVSKPANTQLPKLGQGSAFQPLGQKKQPRSVSGKVSCTNCAKPLGRGAAMIIESLGLHYHIDCFRCCVCSIRLGNGSKGTDVRIRASKLHCQSCYSNDAGFEFTEV